MQTECLMEKFQIAKYGMMQVTALVYGILASGAAVKLNKIWADQGYTMPDTYYRAIHFRDYGVLALGLVVLWTAVVSYLSSPLSKWDVDPDYLTYSGLALTLLYAVISTVIGFGGALAPLHSTFIQPL